MNLNIDITIDLRVKDLEEIVKDHISKRFPQYRVKSLEAKIGQRSLGYGMNETSDPYLKSIEIKLEENAEVFKN